MKQLLSALLILTVFNHNVNCATLHVGTAYALKLLTDATSIAQPGDTIICHNATMTGGMYIENLQGSANKWIYIMAEPGKTVTIQGGNNSIQMSDCAYLHIEGFTIQGQTGNGLNIDDGGSFASPTNHIRIVNVKFQNINASGNNDFLKLSGLDHFEIYHCSFLNGAAGGSGIDMVGCHFGMIYENNFKNLGSNSIQAKGGTSDLEILRNQFDNGGARALNLGGSTDLQFFRPQNATTEAERIKVIANVIQGSEAPVAFVGSRQVEVSNNTILYPKKWVMRILQETVDPTRFLPCGDNSFYNNIIVVDNNVNTEVNIGPDTAPETFEFSNNMWYKSTNANWSGPTLPGTKINQWVDNPEIQSGSTYILSNSSPAIGLGIAYTMLKKDIVGNYFNAHPSLGAYEANPLSTQVKNIADDVAIYPNPFEHELNISFDSDEPTWITLVNLEGRVVSRQIKKEQTHQIQSELLPSGIYFVVMEWGTERIVRMVVKK